VPLQNRVTPLGALVADPARGLVYGNRGCLHDDAGRIRRRFAGKRWIACRLEFKERRRSPLLQPGRYTELFFLDEATAFASGHRPCAECRRGDYDRFVELWRERHPEQTRAERIDEQLHRERLPPPHQEVDPRDLPDGAFVLAGGQPRLVLGSRLLGWTPAGYVAASPVRRPLLITPPSLVQVLCAGWEPSVPFLHPSAQSS
jgi:hypothetical protein